MRHKSLAVTVAVLVVFAVAPVVSASIMTFNGVGLNKTVKVHACGTLADGKRVSAGQLLVTYKSIDYEAYCVDLNHYAGSGEVTEVGILSRPNGDMAAYLFDNYAGDVTTNLEAAALGVAIWEVLYETGCTFNVTHGHEDDGYFSISHNASVADAANDLLGTLPGSYVPAFEPTVLHSICSNYQDVMIPEPATLTLIGLGGLGALLRRRRK